MASSKSSCDTAALDAVGAGEDQADGFAVDAVFFFQDAGGEGFDGVFVEYGDGGLGDYWAGVEGFVDEVDGAAGDLYSVAEGLLLGVEAGEGGQQRRVDV